MAEKSVNRYKRLLKNILLLLTGNFVTKVLTFLMVPFYTSILTTSDYGTADLISTTVLLVLPIFSLLMDEAVMRFVLEKACDKKQVFTIAFTVSSFGFIAVMCISPVILLFDNLRPYYWFVVMYYVVSWIYNIISNYVKGMDKLSITTVAGIIHTFVYLALNIYFLAVIKIGVYGYLLAINLSNLAATLFLIFYCKLYKNFIFPNRIDWNLAKEMVVYSIPMIPDYISWWFNNCADRYMLTFFCGTATNGIYSVAYKIPGILSSLTNIFSSAWKISAVDNFGSEESIKFYNRIYKIYSGFLVMGASGLIIFAKLLAKILFAKDFFLSWKITPILVVAYTLNAQAIFVGSIFTASKKTKKLFYSSLAGAISNIILNAVLIPHYAGIGAAIATAIGYMTIWIININNTKQILKMNFNMKCLIPSYVCLVIEIIAVLLEQQYGYVIASLCAFTVVGLNVETFVYLSNMFLHKVKHKKTNS